MHDCHQQSLQLTDRLPTSHARSTIKSTPQQSFLLIPIDSWAVSCSGFGGNSARTRTRLCLLWLLDEEQLVATHDKERDLSIFWLIRFIFLGFASEENVGAFASSTRACPQFFVFPFRKLKKKLRSQEIGYRTDLVPSTNRPCSIRAFGDSWRLESQCLLLRTLVRDVRKRLTTIKREVAFLLC